MPEAFGVIAIVSLATPGAAQDGVAQASRSHVAVLKECLAEQRPDVRLACLDTAAQTLVEASESGEVKIVDREEVRATRRKLFGFSLPDLGIFRKKDSAGKDEDEEFSQLQTSIASVSGSHSSGYIIRTAEGAVWQIDSPPRRLLTPKVGDSLLIKHGALSAYFIRINEQGGVKAVRIR